MMLIKIFYIFLLSQLGNLRKNDKIVLLLFEGFNRKSMWVVSGYLHVIFQLLLGRTARSDLHITYLLLSLYSGDEVKTILHP